jgi:hypothetical protein
MAYYFTYFKFVINSESSNNMLFFNVILTILSPLNFPVDFTTFINFYISNSAVNVEICVGDQHLGNGDSISP